MDNKPLIKWHSQKLYNLLMKEPNDMLTAKVAVELETVFLNSSPYKEIKAQPPAEKNKIK